MKRTIISAAVLALGIASGGVAVAGPGDGGPGLNGNNDYGLCTAYTNQAEKNPNGPSGPFVSLQEEYDAAAGEEGAFVAYCTDLLGQPEPGNSDGKGKKGEDDGA